MGSAMSGWARLWAAVAAVCALLLAVTVSLALTTDAAPTAAESDAEPADAEPVADDAGPVPIDVELTEFEIVPAEITAPADTPVTFAIANNGTIEHDFVIDGVEGGDSAMVDGGEDGVLEVEGLAAGTYDVICTVPGHADAGMTATLTVTEDAAVETAEADDGHEGNGMDPDMTVEEMAAKHDDLSAFPAETDGEGNQPLEPTMDGGVKVFDLTAEHVEWETEPGVTRQAMAYNGQIPGPRIDVDAGDEVRFVLHNELEVPTAMHFHHLTVPNDMDGVPGLTQESVMPGESFAYEFTISENDVGSQMYHSHFDSAEQVPHGLLGTLIINNPDLDDIEADHDLVMVLNDGPLGYTLNGKGFPATAPLVVDEGETIRIRYYNEGLQIHPMHLHGLRQEVVAYDGNPLANTHLEDNVLVSPGDRVDVLVEATEPGAWAWHCHILSHAEGPDGMFGMVSAIIVE